ncbi:MAG: glycosyltransferase family 4 protein [Chitinophagaceae bacterium]|nr:glycosyltransferase family 4 protein [Chitinophagaceae bacterium]
MKPSVLIIGPAYPLRGGLSSFNERLARQLMQEGHPTEILTFSLQYPSFLFPGTTQYSTDPAPKDLNIKVRINSINPFNWIKVGLQLRQQKPDLIIVRYWLPFMGPCLGSILRIVKGNGHTRIICIADNVIPHEKRFGDQAFTRYFIKPIDAFVTMSEKVMKDLTSFTSKPSLQVVHPLYDNFGEAISKQEARQHLQIDATTHIVLFFGFIRKYKGLDLLFEAIAVLKHQDFFTAHPVKFLIAGEFYEAEQPYLDQIATLNIQDHLILRHHFIPDSEVRDYLSAADCVIQPYKQATQSGVTPLAYHFEKPMIVTNVGGLPALVPPSVGLIAEPTPEDIAEKIKQFFSSDPSHYIAAIQEEKKKYSWQNLVKAILSLSHSK